MIYLYALLIFVTFAVVGGLIVRFIIKAQENNDSDDPPRGVPHQVE